MKGDLIAEYDEDEDRHRNPNPALHDFVQKLREILNAKSAITRENGTIYFSNSQSHRKESAKSQSSSSSHIQKDISDSNNNAKVIEALGNHVVLTEIFKFGGFHDLKNFRLINKQWKGIANSAIIKRRLWKLNFFVKICASKYKNMYDALIEFNDSIEASGGSFPLTVLDFSDLDGYEYFIGPDLPRFYTLIGQSIKHVILQNFGLLTRSEFQDLLVNKMPNVDHIDAGKVLLANDEEDCLLPMVLPCLKTIRLIHDPEDTFFSAFEVLPYYEILLRAAINLKEIQDFRVQLTDTVLKTGKIDCITTFNFASELRTCSDECIKFSQCDLKLTSLTISRGLFDLEDDDEVDNLLLSPELALCLKRILMSSKDTLKHLRCVPGFFPFDFDLPRLLNLEVLTVLDLDKEHWYFYEPLPLPRVFPAMATDSGANFPNLHTVSFDLFLKRSETLYKYFPDQLFPSVNTLEFQDSFQLGKLLKLNFPNVSHIKIINFEKMLSHPEKEELFNSVLASDLDIQIKSLEFHQCLLFGSGREFQLDSLFTGVPAHICAKLLAMENFCNKAGGKDEDHVFAEEILKLLHNQDYAFRNSEGLRRLKIMFNHKDNVHFRISENFYSHLDSEDGGSGIKYIETSKPAMSIITLVSCLYGFSLMRNLEEVIIGYDHSLPNASDIAQLFKPFEEFSYIKIVHEPTKL